MFANLQDAVAVSDRLTATERDPVALAADMSAQRLEQQAAAVVQWRAWLDTNLDRVLALNDAELEQKPEIWSWLFPTGARSRSAPDVPVIGRIWMSDLASTNSALRRAITRSFDRMLILLGLVERNGLLHWREGPRDWATSSRHDRRVYRALRCVHNAGLATQAKMLMRFLEAELGADPARAGALGWYRHQVAS